MTYRIGQRFRDKRGGENPVYVLRNFILGIYTLQRVGVDGYSVDLWPATLADHFVEVQDGE